MAQPQEAHDVVTEFADAVIDYFCLDEFNDVSTVEALDMTRFVMGFVHPLIPDVSRRVLEIIGGHAVSHAGSRK